MLAVTRRRALSIVIAGGLILGLMPGVAAAATRPTTFWLYMGMSCVGGTSTDNATVDVLWKGARGRIKVRDSYRAGRNGGWWEACSSATRVVRPGDVVKATVNGTTRKLVIPDLRLKMNADTDRFFGRAPAGSVIRLNWDSSGLAEINVRVGARGRWSYSHAGYDIVSGLHAYARWRSAKGDTVTFENVAP